MSLLYDYTYTVVGAALFCGIISVLGPSDSKGKVFRFIAGAVLLFCLASPLKNLGGELKNMDLSFDLSEKYDASFAENYTEMIMENEIKSSINACIKEITGQGAEDIEIAISFGNDKYTVDSIRITLENGAYGKTAAVKSVINHRFGVMPEVITVENDEYNG